MANGKVLGVKCPVCGEDVAVIAKLTGGHAGTRPSLYEPGDPPEAPDLEEVEEILFENCDHDTQFLEEKLNSQGEIMDYTRLKTVEAGEFWGKVDAQIDENECEYYEHDDDSYSWDEPDYGEFYP